MVNLQELVNRRNPVTVYSPTRVLGGARANAGTARRVLSQHAAPAWASQSTQSPTPSLSLGGGGAPQAAMPDTAAMMGGTNIEQMLARARQVTGGQQDEGGGGGLGGFLGSVVNSAPGRVAMGALTVLDYPRRIVASGVQEAADAFNGGDASWDDFVSQVHEGIGFGDILGSTGNIWLDRGLGFIGDVALDPLTYVGGAGILAGTGREARAGLAARVLELGMGEELSQRVGRIGIHALSNSERDVVRRGMIDAGGVFAEGADKIKNAGYHFRFPFTERTFDLPGTAIPDRLIGGSTARARMGIAASPIGGWLRHRNADAVMVDALDRLVAGKGPLSIGAAGEAYNWYQAFRLGMNMSKQEANAALKSMIDQHGIEGLRGMVDVAEREGGTAINGYFDRMAKVMEDMGINHGRVKPDVAGEGIHYVPHYYTDPGKEWLGKQTATSKAMAATFGAGHSLEDYSPSLMKRHFVGRAEPYKINGQDFHIPTGTVAEINAEFRRVTGEKFDLLETDFTKIAARYGASVGEDVGTMTAVQRLLKSKSGMLRSREDHEVLKAIVDDAGTRLATENKKSELAEQLNHVGHEIGIITEEISRRVHVATDSLSPRLQGVIDELSSLGQDAQFRLTHALETDNELARAAGVTSLGGQTNPYGQLRAALDAERARALESINRLAAEHVSLQRNAQLQRSALLSELARTPTAAFSLDAPRYFADLQRYQQLSRRLAETQRDADAIDSLQGALIDAATKADRARGLAENDAFLTQFIPGPEGMAPGSTREIVGYVPAYEDPRMSTQAIYGRANTDRENLLTDDYALANSNVEISSEFESVRSEYEAMVTDIKTQSDRVSDARLKVESLHRSAAPQLQGARQQIEGLEIVRAGKLLDLEALDGVSGVREQRLRLRGELREFDAGPLATARSNYDQLRAPLNQAKTDLEAQGQALVRQQNQLLDIARRMDDEMYYSGSRDEGWNLTAATVPPDLPPVSMTAEEHRRATELLAQDTRAHAAAHRNGRLQRARAAQAADSAELEQVDSQLRSMTEGWTGTSTGDDYRSTLVDQDGNIVLRDANERANYEEMLSRDEAQRNFDYAQNELDARRAELHAGDVDETFEGGAREQLMDRIRQLEDKVETHADLRDKLNTRIANRQKRGAFYPDVEGTQNRIARAYALAERKATLAKRIRRATSITERVDPGYRSRELRIAALTEDLAEYDASSKARFAAGRQNVRRQFTEAAAERARMTDLARPHIYEADTRRIAEREARQLARRSSLVGFTPEWGEVAPLDVDSMGLRAFTPDERLQWEHARAIVSEAGNFPGGRSNDIVKAAQARIDELRPKIGYGESAYDYGITQTDYGDLRQAMDEIDESRRTFAATPEERKLIDSPINLRGQGGDTSIARRGRRARRLARWIDKRVLPELSQRGAIGPGSDLLGRADVAGHYRMLMDKLQGALNMKGREASMFSIAAVEQASADVNRLSEIMLRYQRALANGLEPSPSLGAFITERVYKREHDALVKEIAEGDRRLAARATSGRTAKARQALAAQGALPQRLASDMVSAEEAAEIRHLAKEAAYKDAIKRDRAVIDEIEQRRAIGDFSTDDKATRTRARSRITRNGRALIRHQALPVHTGLVSDVVDNVAATIDNAIVELDNSVSGLNDVRSTMGSATRVTEKLNSLRAQHAQTQGWVDSYSAGNDRLSAAIKRAETNGEVVVRYRPTAADDFMMTIEQAEARLESGTLPEYLHEQVRQAIARAKRSRRMPSGPVMVTKVGEKEGLRSRIAELLAKRNGPGINQAESVELEQATTRMGKIEKFEQAFPDAVEEVNAETGMRKLRSRRSQARDVAESDVTRFAAEQGVSPRDVISSKEFRTVGPAGMETMPIDAARDLWTRNTKAIAERRASLDTYTEHISVLDGTVNDDIAITRAILDDQAGQLPDPDELERTIAEINNRAAAETRALDPNEQVSMSDLGAAIRGETEIEVTPARELTKEEKLSIQTLQERANAVRKYGQMTPEQLSSAQAKLNEKLRNVERYRNEMGDRFDMADAAIDDGQRYFEDLVSGRRNPTTRDVELMRSLLGAEGGEYAATMVRKLNDLLGLSYSPTRKDLDFLTRKLGRTLPPLPAGGSRTMMMSRYDPSAEDLQQLWNDLRDIPAVLLDETQAAQRAQWMQGVQELIAPAVTGTPRTLNPDELGSVFAELEMYFKGTQVLESMKRRVHELADEGMMVTDQDLRGTIGQALVKSAQVHRDDGITNVLNMLTYLGISFPPNTPGFSGKLQALGYSMSRQDFNEATLRSFVERRMGELGLPIDTTLTHLQTQRRIRLQRLKTMRLGLGGTVRSMPPGLDPRQLFEEIGRTGEHSITHIDAELARFKEIQVPQLGDEAIERPGVFEAPPHLAELVAEREARLTEQIDEARAAGDMAKVDELSTLREQLDGRNIVDPEDEPALTGELDRGQPAAAAEAPDYERQLADAESEVTDARSQRDQAAGQLAAARDASEGGPNPNALRNPDTPEGLLSAAEIISRNQQITRLAGTMPPEQYDELVHAWEVEVGQKIWRGEPPESIEAARDALSEEGGGVGADALEAAQSKLNQAELALAEAESQMARLRRDGAATLSPAETPAEPLGQVEQVARDADPDEALTFDQADAEYRNALNTVEGAEDPQQAAQAASRARKMADLRARLWPAREAELKGQRNQLILEHLGRVPVEDRTVIPKDTVTWEWTQVATKGVPNQRMIRRSLGTGRANRVVADVTGMASTAGGPFRRETLPTAAARIEQRLAPADEVRQMMLEAAATADGERAEIEGLLAAYDGRDPSAELARLANERAEAKAAIARLPGEEIAEQRTAELTEQLAINQADTQDTAATINDALAARSAELDESQQRYTESLRSANRELADTRTAIRRYRTIAGQRTREANKMQATLEYQGISHADLTSHISDLRALNASRATMLDPADQADIDMISALLDNAAEQSASLTQLEGRKVDFTQQIADFKSGATSVEPVMRKVLADGWSPIFKELAQGSDAVVAANDLATALTNLTAGLRKPETWGLLDDYTRFFKTYATATPGFHVRNMLSGVFMNLVDNVRVREMRRAPGIWRDFTRNPTEFMDGLAVDSDIRKALMVVFGSGASGVFHDVGGRTEGLVGTRIGRSVMDNWLTRWNQRAGSRVEGTLRLSMALDSMTKGQSVAAAAERVARYHFDYTRLSSLDRQARRLIPFWTFMSRNLPLQIESMWLRPRTYLQYQSFVRNFGEAADPLTPEYWLSQGAFTMDTDAEGSEAPWYLAPDLPHLRLAEQIDAIANRDIGKAIGANINPLVMAPAEAFAFGRKVYTGQDINQEYNPPTKAMLPLMPLLALLGGAEKGGTSGDWLLDDRYAHVARSLLPMLNLAERLTDQSGTREGRTDETLLRTLGAPVYQLTDRLRTGTQRSANYDRRDAVRSQADLARK